MMQRASADAEDSPADSTCTITHTGVQRHTLQCSHHKNTSNLPSYVSPQLEYEELLLKLLK